MAVLEACTTHKQTWLGWFATCLAELTCVPHSADSREGVGQACLGVATDTRSRHACCGQSAIPFEMGMPGAKLQLTSTSTTGTYPL